MAIDELRWDESDGAPYKGDDIHIVRQGGQAATVNNQTEPLRPRLKGFLNGNPEPFDPSTAVITTQPADLHTNTSKYGVDINSQAGVTVTFAEPAPLGGLRLHNFLIRATSGVAPELAIRVHVHKARVGLTLAPSTLTVRADDGPMGFSLIAAFDDGTSADVSLHAGLTWSRTGTGFTIDANTGKITVDANATSGGGTVTVTVPFNLGGGSASASVQIGPKWESVGNTSVAVLLNTGGAGFAKRLNDDVCNILFLPEGFGDTETFFTKNGAASETVSGETAFMRNAAYFAHTLTSNTLSPYDLVKGRFNFFAAWITPPSFGAPARGVTQLSTRAKVPRKDRNNNPIFQGRMLPFPSKPTGPGGTISRLSDLAFVAGLPTKDDPVDPEATLPATVLQNWKDRWKALYGDNVVQFAGGLTAEEIQTMVRSWAELRERHVDPDANTLFSMGCGSRARVNKERDSVETIIDYHPRRGGRTATNTMLNKLQCANAGGQLETVGTMWTDENLLTRNFLVFICKTLSKSGARSGNEVTVGANKVIFEKAAFSIADVGEHPVLSTNTPFPAFGYTMQYMPVPIIAVGAHELSHLVGLGDEYAHFTKNFVDGTPSALRNYFNIQAEKDVDPTGTSINTANIKWKWPKCARAAVLTEALVEQTNGGAIEVVAKVGVGEAVPFQVGDHVAVRPPGLLAFSLPTKRFKVKTKPVAGVNSLTLQYDTGSSSPLPPSATGYILYQFEVGPVDVDGLDITTVIHRDVLSSLKTRGALTRASSHAACSLAGEERQDASGRQRVLNGPQKLKRIGGTLVGLYDGGHAFRCGVFHAVGDCLMRSQPLDRVIPFCHVCKYALVDKFTPSAHKDIDQVFDYPGAKKI